MPLRLLLGFSVVLAAALANAGNLTVTMTDAAGRAVADVVIVATAVTPTTPTLSTPTNTPAIMDQIDTQFVPEVLAIRVGTAVQFPNSDSVAHQVYSFSPAKHIELPLYRGRPHAPVIFDRPGIVTLGCNIHDRMTGYIFVTASPYFGKTDAAGRWVFNALPSGEYRVSAWSPNFVEQPSELTVSIGQHNTDLAFALSRNVRPQRRPTDNPRIRDY